MNIIIKTLGCKANRWESDRLIDKFSDKFNIADSYVHKFDQVDLIIVNTCTVTHVADRKSRQAIASLKAKNPNSKVIVFGCGANTNAQEYQALENVDYVVSKREELDRLIIKLGGSEIKGLNDFDLNKARTRALVKIQDGCNNFCAYCIVPYARGREKSRDSKEILDEINKKIDKGYKEIVLTGINIGHYKENNLDLAGLIETILGKTTIQRLRLSSIEPENFTDKFIELFKNPRFCPHLHISLQSGSDTILKLMNRRYDSKFYANMIKSLRKAVPHISITTDIIVGFPGETDELFEETCDFVKKTGFSKIHIFPYSKRKGTVASNMPNQIPFETKKARCKILSKLEKKLRKKFQTENIGRTESVLIEDESTGFTSNYIKVRVHKKIKPNEMVEVKLSKKNIL